MRYAILQAMSLIAAVVVLCAIIVPAAEVSAHGWGVVTMKRDWNRVFASGDSAVEASLVADHLTGIEWRVTELSGHPVATTLHGEQPFLFFDQAKPQARGYAGCNRFFGGYEINGGKLKFGPIGGTKRACPDLEEGIETEFFKALDATRSWRIVEGSLQLLNDGLVLARFQKVPEGR